ncbi:Zinc finger protein JAGGED, partial [Mucuna pruriens]
MKQCLSHFFFFFFFVLSLYVSLMGLKGKKGVMEVALIGWLWLQVAGKRKAAGRMEKTSVGRSTSVDFVPLSSAKRETETLNQARQLVFRSDHNIAPQTAPHLGCCQPIGSGGYHPQGDPTVPLRFPRYFSGSSSTHMPPPPPPPPPPPQPYLYASPSRPVSFGSSHFPHQHAVNDYYVGHVMSSSHGHGHYVGGGGGESGSSYTCIGAPVGQGGFGGKDGSLHNNQEEGLSWGRSYSGAQHRLDPPSAINRFQDEQNYYLRNKNTLAVSSKSFYQMQQLREINIYTTLTRSPSFSKQ